jgi:hypothetical protein
LAEFAGPVVKPSSRSVVVIHSRCLPVSVDGGLDPFDKATGDFDGKPRFLAALAVESLERKLDWRELERTQEKKSRKSL